MLLYLIEILVTVTIQSNVRQSIPTDNVNMIQVIKKE